MSCTRYIVVLGVPDEVAGHLLFLQHNEDFGMEKFYTVEEYAIVQTPQIKTNFQLRGTDELTS